MAAFSTVNSKLSNRRMENAIQTGNNGAQELSYPIEGSWLNGWTWRKSHCINNATGAGSDYQIQITVINGTGADSGGTVYVNGKCQTDFGDVRFTGDDGATLLDYWLESKYVGENATFWVKVSADLSSLNQNIYVYYGNSAVSSTSSFDNTFIFGDPFDNSSLDTSRWTAVDGVTAYSVNSTEHYLEVTNMTPDQGTGAGLGFHSRNFSMPSNWIVQDAYSDEGFVMYHESKASSDMFGQLVSLQNSTNVGSHGGVAYVMVHDGWVADMDVSDSAVVGSDFWDSGAWLPPMPYTTRWTMKRTSDGLITLTQNGVDRIARMNNDTVDRMTWELWCYNYTGAGFGTERLYAFLVRKYVNPEPSHGSWGSEEHKITVPDDYPTIQAAINAASDGDTVFVRNGTYYEHVVIDKKLTVLGESNNGTIIDGNQYGNVVEVVSSNVVLRSFTVQNGGVDDNSCLVKMTQVNNTLIEMNNFLGNGELGIWLTNSSNNVVRNNLIKNLPIGGVVGSDYSYFDSGINNTISNNVILQDGSGVAVIDTSSNIVEYNDIQECSMSGIDVDGMEFLGPAKLTEYNVIRGNRIVNSSCGISVWLQVDNTMITENYMANNGEGLYIATNAREIPSPGNIIYHNSFINNSIQFYDRSVYHPSLDFGYPNGGNYWDDYVSVDFRSGPGQNSTGSDGILDFPHAVPFFDDLGNIVGYLYDNYPLAKPYCGQHDIGIVSLVPSRTVIAEGYGATVNVEVTVVNYGEQAETFNFTFQTNATTEEQTLLLAGRNSTTLYFAWNTSNLPRGNYTIVAVAEPVPNETDKIDNTQQSSITVTIPGDVNGDGTVNILDAIAVSNAFLATPSSSNWNPNADINGDGVVNILDAIILSNNFLQTTLL